MFLSSSTRLINLIKPEHCVTILYIAKASKCASYCKFGNFRENFIFANGVKIDICDIKKSRLGNVLPISVNDRVISPFCEDLISSEVSRK